MSLARAFTKRTKERFGGSRNKTSAPIQRHLISSPIALISSTNAQLFDALDIADAQVAMASDTSSSSSLRTSTDANSLTACSTLPSTVEGTPTHESADPLAYYFPDSPTPNSQTSHVFNAEQTDAPVLPKRAPSHSKREHVRLARHRSIRSSTQSSSSSGGKSVIVDGTHPFSRELEQLNEMAEEFGLVANNAAFDEDTRDMQSKGLVKFSVEEYMAEIEDLMAGVFEEGDFNGWI